MHNREEITRIVKESESEILKNVKLIINKTKRGKNVEKYKKAY